MRDILNSILTFIGAESLTDDEFAALTIDTAPYNQATYEALDAVLAARESVSSLRDRLSFFFKAKGVEITTTEQGSSNIYLGDVLC